MVLLALSIAACRSDETDAEKTPAASDSIRTFLNVSPAALAFGAEGGTLAFAVTGTDIRWTAASAAAWLTIDGGTGEGDGIVCVAARPNASTLPQQTTIRITPDGECGGECIVSVTQAAAPAAEETFLPATVRAIWEDDSQTEDSNTLRLAMTDVSVRNGIARYPGYDLRLDLSIPKTEFDKAAAIVAGTYTAGYDRYAAARSYTFDSEKASRIEKIDASGNIAETRYTTDGTVDIGRSGDIYTIESRLALDDGTVCRVRYAGAIAFFDNTVGHLSTLVADVRPQSLSAGGIFLADSDLADVRMLQLTLFGDILQSGYDHLTLLLCVDPAARKQGGVEGTYTVVEKDPCRIVCDDIRPGTIVPGDRSVDADGGTVYSGSWYRRLTRSGNQAVLTALAPFRSGRITIVREAANYRIDYRFVDDDRNEPHVIAGGWSGEILFDGIE